MSTRSTPTPWRPRKHTPPPTACLVPQPERPLPELLGELASQRVRVRDAEEAIEMLADDFSVELEDSKAADRLVCVIDRVIECKAELLTNGGNPAEIIATARLLERLQALRAELEAVTA